jgi:hypothetical protein
VNRLFGLVLVVGVVILLVRGHLSEVRDASKESAHWKLAREITGNGSISPQLVEIDPDHAKNRAIYDNAVSVLCADRSLCSSVDFFIRGDRIPPSQTAKSYNASGGVRNYPTVVRWQGGDYTQWDCERAGAEGAPLAALCGVDIRQAFSAVLSLTGRSNTAEYCGWPKNDNDRTLVRVYISNMPDHRRREYFQRAVEKYPKGGPDDPKDCTRLRPNIEKQAAEARKFLASRNSFASAEARPIPSNTPSAKSDVGNPAAVTPLPRPRPADADKK